MRNTENLGQVSLINGRKNHIVGEKITGGKKSSKERVFCRIS